MYFHAYHRSLRYIFDSGLDALAGALAADLHETSERRCQELGEAIALVSKATLSELKVVFRRLRRGETTHDV
jgi:hypothetical protein